MHRTPTLSGCECPCSAPDGVLYEAAWFSAGAAAAAAEAEAAKVAKGKEEAVKAGATLAAAAPRAPASASTGGPLRWLLRFFSCAFGGVAKPAAESDIVDVSNVEIRGDKSTQVCLIS